MRHSCIIYAVVACCLLHLSSADPEKNGQAGTVAQHQRNDSSSALGNASQGESEIMAAARNASHTKTGLLFDENYATMLNGKPSADIDLMNDSAEVDDSIDEFKDFVLPRETTRPSVKKSQNFKNVYKVPKKVVKSAPTITSVLGQASLRSDRTINDFNPETFFPSENSNQSYFHAFSNLYDHFTWSASSFAFLDEPCMSDMNSYLDGLRRSLDWAVKASDASGRYRGLFFFDNDFWLGSKSCCYDINIEKRAIGQLEMKFFVVKILVKLPSTTTTRLLHIGQCLPKSCSSNDVSTIMSLDPAFLTLTKTTAQGEQNDLKLFEARAVPGEANIWKEKKLFVFGSIILTIFILIVIATCYENSLASQGFDMSENGQQEPRRKKSSLVGIKCGLKDTERHEMNHMNNNNEAEGESEKICEGHKLGFTSKILLCFAYGSNSSVILSTKTNSEDSLSCIHGLRFFTLLWTIMVHTYLQMFAIGENRFIRKISERTFFYQIVGNATYSVDTFFFIGGLLVVLLFLKADKKKRQANENIPSNFWGASLRRTFVMIFYRFLRLTPVYVVIIVFTELTMKVMYNESVFTPGLSDHETCKEFWWRNVLYINNFFPLSQICLMWSWYLANDFQFYMVAIFLLILSRRYLKLSLFASVLLLLSSWLMSIYMSVHNKYTHKVSEPFESFDILYDKPWQRFGPYAMGMVAGYILNRVKVPPKVPLIVNLGLWVLSMFTLFIVVFGVPSGELSILMTSLYVSLGHTAWGLALMWPTLSCSWKLAQPINNFLSFNGFFPLSRLTYCTYLIHPTVMMITSFDCDGAMHLKHSMILTSFLGNSVISFLFAFVLSIMFEAPVIRLLKLCFR